MTALIFLCVCALINAAASYVIKDCKINVANNSVVKEYESQLVLSDEYKDVVLVLGGSKQGKSTTVQWIAGANLKSVPSSSKSRNYDIIDDDDKIGTNSNSKTIYPELVVDKDTNTAYYDLPGFDDTRGIEYDIAGRYFIKQVIDYVDSLKILFVMSYSTITTNDCRTGLIAPLKHLTDLLNDVDKYRNGIGMVVTMVDASTVSDETVIRDTVVPYLQGVADHIQQIEQSNATPDDDLFKDKVFCEKAIQFINSLLVSECQLYKKIALFRSPDREGFLKDISNLEEEKQSLENMVTKNLQFIQKQSDDFCYKVTSLDDESEINK